MAKQVVVIHGGETFDTYEDYLAALRSWEFDPARTEYKDWKKRLQDSLGDSYNVIAPVMPNKYNAKYQEWAIWFEKVIPHLQDNVMLVGHSLGGLFLMKYLAEHTLAIRIGGIFIVAAPFTTTGTVTTLADFKIPSSLDGVWNQCGNIFFYHSTDDPVVPIDNLYLYQQSLPFAHVSIYSDRAHFNQEVFPELVADIQGLR